MRRIVLLVIACCAAVAQEDPRARAREIEIQAERALGEGRRDDALKLLREAADLRAKARATDRRLDQTTQESGAEPPPMKPVETPPPPLGAGVAERATAADGAIGELDAALEKGDAGAARKAAVRARELLAAWASDLGERERRLAESPVEKRVAELEAQVSELMKRVPKR